MNAHAADGHPCGARLLQQSRLSGSQQSELLDTMARRRRGSTMDERLPLLGLSRSTRICTV
ncbi:MAG: hypothetical protein ACLUI3_08470 [Christensenellales bacterium]